ncbi:MAG: histidine--tRNA ligase [Desulfobulbus propionicus]|nr:MAG: histidine--tRNA ligase [Desulfobulbus propionicus]
MKIQAINGFKDILPADVSRWQYIERIARSVFERFGLREIRTPILEATELFVRSIGQATDVVEKEMYTFADKGITMRPEGTASIMRAFIEHGMHVQQPVHRLYTIGPMFRHERPQKGRLRQFHQLDAEVIGADEAMVDAELIAMADMLFTELGLDVSLELNSLGCRECRPGYRKHLLRSLETRQEDLCDDCRRRTTTNPLRVLDCKKAPCRQVAKDTPSLLEGLCTSCDAHFKEVRDALCLLDVPYTINRFMVRGLDYYTRTTFEFLTTDLGAQAAVGAGGRYDGLIEELGGPALPGVGFAMGMERIALLLEQQKKDIPGAAMDLFLATLGTAAARHAVLLATHLRRAGAHIGMDHSGRGLKAQMKMAGRINARRVLILGENELEQGEAVLRDMRTQEQCPFPLTGDTTDQAKALLQVIG